MTRTYDLPEYGIKELNALIWVAERSDHGSVQVTHFIDKAGVGWLDATIRRKVGNHRWETETFRVSPLGHVYLDGEVVREGPPIK